MAGSGSIRRVRRKNLSLADLLEPYDTINAATFHCRGKATAHVARRNVPKRRAEGHARSLIERHHSATPYRLAAELCCAIRGKGNTLPKPRPNSTHNQSPWAHLNDHHATPRFERKFADEPAAITAHRPAYRVRPKTADVVTIRTAAHPVLAEQWGIRAAVR